MYRTRAKERHDALLAKRIKATVFLTVEPLTDGGFFINDHSFFMNYVHTNVRWQTQQDIDRVAFIRNSHIVLINHTQYYIHGFKSHDDAQKFASGYDYAKHSIGCKCIYRLD